MKFSTHLQSHKQFHLTKICFMTLISQPYVETWKVKKSKTLLHHTWNLPSIFHCHQRNEMNQHDKKANEKTLILLWRVCFAAFDIIIICLSLVNNYSRWFTEDWPTPPLTFFAYIWKNDTWFLFNILPIVYLSCSFSIYNALQIYSFVISTNQKTLHEP